MGVCASNLTPQEQQVLKQMQDHTRLLEKNLKEQHRAEARVIKVLLLGAGESGKSTVFKQMILIHGRGFSDEERLQYKPIVASNVLTSIQALCRMSVILSRPPYNLQTTPLDDVVSSFRVVAEVKQQGFDSITPEFANHVKALWADKGIQETYTHKSKFYLIDSAEYFLSNVSKMAAPGYIPSTDDVLRARMRTTAIIEQDFEIDGNLFRFVDVGGQRNERRKWIHCFAGVTSVLFVVSLAGYDQVLYEDDTTNRMDEALALFEEVCQLEYFRDTSMILFLNKSDLFRPKVVSSPLQNTYPEYAAFLDAMGAVNSYDAGVSFIEQMFLHLNRSNRQVFPHTTCATDKKMMQHVFDSVRRIILRRNLQQGGLIASDDQV